jgi:hypothetical protein
MLIFVFQHIDANFTSRSAARWPGANFFDMISLFEVPTELLAIDIPTFIHDPSPSAPDRFGDGGLV